MSELVTLTRDELEAIQELNKSHIHIIHNLEGVIQDKDDEIKQLKVALEALISASVAYQIINAEFWNRTVGQSMPTSINDATFQFDEVLVDCQRIALGLSSTKEGKE